MEFKHIEYFLKTCEYTSMSKAAEALYISQQALSRCIAGMEQELGCQLFQRTVKGISLTKEGMYLLNKFSPLVTQYHHVLDEVTEHFESQPVKLQFCCAPLIFRCIDPELLFDFQEKI